MDDDDDAAPALLVAQTESFGVGGLPDARLSVGRLHRSPRLVPQLLRQAFLLVRQLEVGLVRRIPVHRRHLRRHVAPAVRHTHHELLIPGIYFGEGNCPPSQKNLQLPSPKQLPVPNCVIFWPGQ